MNENGLTITNQKNGSEHFDKGVFVVYDWETKSKKELNADAFLLQPNEAKQLSCKLESTQVVSFQVTSEKEILLLPKFVV